ncbi:MAG: glutathione S-transferase family protein, partial [Pseudomonadota bacterium]
MKVISFRICPFVQRVTALLEAKGLAYDIEYISLSDKPRWFLDLSPHGQVPVLITETGQALFESDAIAEYLDEAYPPLLPGLTPEEKATHRAWSALASKNYLVQCGAQRSPDAATLAERGARLSTAFDRIGRQLGATRYFAGDQLGMVDIAWLPLVHRAQIIARETGYDFLGDRPGLKAWQQSLMATGLAEKSVAPDFEQAFADFYLSDQTYLGRGGDVPRAACCGEARAPAG